MNEVINTLQQELSSVRGLLENQSKRCNAAEDALRFYSNVKNYTSQSGYLTTIQYQNVLVGDLEDAENSRNVKVAGQRARSHFKQYEALQPV